MTIEKSEAVSTVTKDDEKHQIKDLEIGKDAESIEVGSSDEAGSRYTREQYKHVKRKTDKYLLPILWLAYGLQQTDKTALGTQATFGIREDTGLVGQQYSWLTTIFYLMYMICEAPANWALQRWSLGRLLSSYMIVWGIVVLCIGFAKNFTHLIVLRALQGALECSISPGFVLIVGSFYTTSEHPSRMLVFQSANAGFGIIASLVLYGIGITDSTGFQSWRGMSFFLGGMTTLVGILSLFLIGSPSEVPWLTAEEKDIANDRILKNNAGDDRTGNKTWNWSQVVECFKDPVLWFTGLNAFLSSVPNGGSTTFGSIIQQGFGFTNLQIILLDIPRSATSVLVFIAVGITVSKVKNLRMYFMMAGVVPAFTGFMVMALLPNEDAYRWSKWGGYFMSVTFVLPLFLSWSLLSSNVSGRTKKSVANIFTFICYCVGNMVGSQIFYSTDAPRYIHGLIGCVICFGLSIFIIVSWRLLYVWRNKRNERFCQEQGISPEERSARAKELGKQDKTDLENPYYTYSL